MNVSDEEVAELGGMEAYGLVRTCIRRARGRSVNG